MAPHRHHHQPSGTPPYASAQHIDPPRASVFLFSFSKALRQESMWWSGHEPTAGWLIASTAPLAD